MRPPRRRILIRIRRHDSHERASQIGDISYWRPAAWDVRSTPHAPLARIATALIDVLLIHCPAPALPPATVLVSMKRPENAAPEETEPTAIGAR